jgi:plastocyanin
MTSAALRKLTLAVVAIAIVAVFAACGDDDTTAPPNNGTFNGTIQVRDNFFSPSSATIDVGDSVTWHWNGGNAHTATSTGTSDFTFDSGTKTTGTFGFRFNNAGTAHYFCTVHGTSMSGTITVKP